MLINKIQEHLHNLIANNELSNDDIIKLIEQLGSYLNLKTIPGYAKENNMSYNGVKKFRTIVTLFNVKMVVDNE